MNSINADFLSIDELKKYKFKKIGKKVLISKNAVLVGTQNISIGDYTRIDPFTMLISPRGYIRIGKASHISTNVLICGHKGVQMGNFCGLGPGTGVLIKKLNDIKNIKKIDAYELNSNYLNLLNKNNKFGKLYKNIDKINKKYDLIVLSHSFFHLINLYEDISKIKSLLKKNGLLIIITPDPLNYPVLPFIYEIFSFSNKNNILSYLEKFGLFINRDLKSVLKNEIFVILSRIKSQKRVNKDKNFLKKFKTIQKKLLIKIQILKKEKALIIEGAGIGGTFFLYNLKKNIFKIYDKYLGTNMIINKKLKDIKIKKNIKSFNINKILKTYN